MSIPAVVRYATADDAKKKLITNEIQLRVWGIGLQEAKHEFHA